MSLTEEEKEEAIGIMSYGIVHQIHLDRMMVFVRKGLDPDYSAGTGATLLMAAATLGLNDHIIELIGHGANIDAQEQNIIIRHYVCYAKTWV